MMESDDIIREKIILAPMVRGSELAFRALVRQQGGGNIHNTPCFSPMVRAEQVVKAYDGWKSGSIDTSKPLRMDDTTETGTGLHEDEILFLQDIMLDKEPLVVQVCGCVPDVLYQACRILLQLNQSPHNCQIQGIDLNLGCPQHCALVGKFGSFLAEEQPKLASECVAAMRRALEDDAASTARSDETTNGNDSNKTSALCRPRLSCKIRLRETVEDTIQFAKELQTAGCEMLTVHCRRREEKHRGLPDYAAGATIVAALTENKSNINNSSNVNMKIVINGNVLTVGNAREILNITKAHAVMVARGFLCNPLLLKTTDVTSTSIDTTDTTIPPQSSQPSTHDATNLVFLAASYLDHAEAHPPPSPLYIRTHFRWLFRTALEPEDKYNRDYASWKVRLWTFLVRPYLETVTQFRQVVALYARHKNEEDAAATSNSRSDDTSLLVLPPSLVNLANATFHDIRCHAFQPLDEDDTAAEGGLSLGLFD